MKKYILYLNKFFLILLLITSISCEKVADDEQKTTEIKTGSSYAKNEFTNLKTVSGVAKSLKKECATLKAAYTSLNKLCKEIKKTSEDEITRRLNQKDYCKFEKSLGKALKINSNKKSTGKSTKETFSLTNVPNKIQDDKSDNKIGTGGWVLIAVAAVSSIAIAATAAKYMLAQKLDYTFDDYKNEIKVLESGEMMTMMVKSRENAFKQMKIIYEEGYKKLNTKYKEDPNFFKDGKFINPHGEMPKSMKGDEGKAKWAKYKKEWETIGLDKGRFNDNLELLKPENLKKSYENNLKANSPEGKLREGFDTRKHNWLKDNRDPVVAKSKSNFRKAVGGGLAVTAITALTAFATSSMTENLSLSSDNDSSFYNKAFSGLEQRLKKIKGCR